MAWLMLGEGLHMLGISGMLVAVLGVMFMAKKSWFVKFFKE